MKNKTRVQPGTAFRLLPIPLAAAALCGAVPVLAQETAAAGVIELDEITVTATRRAEGVQDIPLNISAVNGDEIERQGITDLAELMRVVPGIFVVDQGPRASNLLTVRGLNVSSLNASEFLGNGNGGVVSLYLGDIPLYVDLKLMDIDRVEVLLGPQGTLYGVGTLGGAIRYIPNAPDPNVTSVAIDGSAYVRSHSEGIGHETTLTANLPIVRNRLALRASVGYFNDPGFIDYDYLVREPGVSNPQPDRSDAAAVAANLRSEEDADEEQTLSGRFALGFKPSEAFDATLTYYYQNQDVGARTINHDDAFATGRYVSGARFVEPNERENQLVSLELNADFGFASLTSATGASTFEEVGQRDQTDLLLAFEYGYEDFPSFVAFTRETNEEERLSQEIRLVSRADSRVNWIVGAFYNHFNQDASSREFVPGFPGFAGIDRPDNLEFIQITYNTFEETAVFGELGFDFTENFQATIGGRWFHFDGDQNVGFDLPLLNGTPDQVFLSFQQGLVDDGDEVYKFNMSYKFSPDVMGYFTLSEGYRTGGSNAVPLCASVPPPPGQNVCATPQEASFDPDKTVNTELGLRSSLMNNRVVFNAALYQIDWQDVQVAGTTQFGAIPITVNGARAETKGVEASLRARISDQLKATLNYSFADAVISEFSPGIVDGIDARPGDRLPGSPRHQGNFLLSFVEPLSNGWRLEADYGLIRASNVLTRVGGEANGGETLDGFTLHNASVGIAGGAWNVRLYGTNLTDEYAETGARQNRSFIRSVGGFQLRRYHKDVIDPLAVGLSFGYQFTI